MYTLLSGMYRHLTQKDDYFVLILGLDNAGKTTFLESAKTKFTKDYRGVNPSKITSTVGLNIGKIDVKGIRLNFWDLGESLLKLFVAPATVPHMTSLDRWPRRVAGVVGQILRRMSRNHLHSGLQ